MLRSIVNHSSTTRVAYLSLSLPILKDTSLQTYSAIHMRDPLCTPPCCKASGPRLGVTQTAVLCSHVSAQHTHHLYTTMSDVGSTIQFTHACQILRHQITPTRIPSLDAHIEYKSSCGNLSLHLRSTLTNVPIQNS